MAPLVWSVSTKQAKCKADCCGAPIEGLTRFVTEYVEGGFEPYIVTFHFRSLPESDRTAIRIMESEVGRVFGRFITEVVRNPSSQRNADNRPILIGCPDWPVYKRNKANQGFVTGSGIHFAGILLIPLTNRLKTGVRSHFKQKKQIYIRPDHRLARIHVEHVSDDLDQVVDYSFKALKWRRCAIDDLLILPRSRTE